MQDFPAAECLCPHCQKSLNAGLSMNEMNDEAPNEGDLSVCISCGGLLKFDEALRVICLGEEEIFDIIREDPEAYAALMKAQKAIITMHSKTDQPETKKRRRDGSRF